MDRLGGTYNTVPDNQAFFICFYGALGAAAGWDPILTWYSVKIEYICELREPKFLIPST